MKTLIICSSYPRSASTLLVNALYGMVPALEHKKVFWDDFRHSNNNNYQNVGNTIIIKTHDVNIDEISRALKDHYRLYFVCSERGGNRFDNRFRSWPNVAIFDYSELNETAELPLVTIIDNIYTKVSRLIPGLTFSRLGALRRVATMNERYDEIKNFSFDFVDDFYQLHGSHRTRGPARLRGRP